MSENNNGYNESRDIITLGCVISAIISFSENHSVAYSVLHGLLSWIYVVYALIEKEGITLF